jgi:hypothetical protein
MIKLKTYKTFIKNQEKKLKVKRIRTQIETIKTNMTNLYFLRKEREKKKKSLITNHPSFVNMHHIKRKRT